MGAKLTKYIRQNIDSYFTENDDGTTTVSFGGSPIKLGSSAANFLKQIIVKKLNSTKNKIVPGDMDMDMVDKLNQMAYTMIKKTGLTPQQKKEVEISKMVKKIK